MASINILNVFIYIRCVWIVVLLFMYLAFSLQGAQVYLVPGLLTPLTWWVLAKRFINSEQNTAFFRTDLPKFLLIIFLNLFELVMLWLTVKGYFGLEIGAAAIAGTEFVMALVLNVFKRIDIEQN